MNDDTDFDPTPSADIAAAERAAHPTPAEAESSLALALVQVANLRARVDAETKYMDELLTVVKESEAYKHAEVHRAAYSTSLQEAEANAKRLALEAFQSTGIKSRAGITIKRFTTVRVDYDYTQAFKWAQERAPELIVLDQKLFADYAKLVRKSMPVPCVQIVEEVEDRAQIDTDLTKCKGPLGAPKK